MQRVLKERQQYEDAAAELEQRLAERDRENKELKTRGAHIFNPANNSIIYELAYKQRDEWIVQGNNILSIQPTEQVQMIILRSRNQHFLSSDGSSGGFLQIVTLRRNTTPS